MTVLIGYAVVVHPRAFSSDMTGTTDARRASPPIVTVNINAPHEVQRRDRWFSFFRRLAIRKHGIKTAKSKGNHGKVQRSITIGGSGSYLKCSKNRNIMYVAAGTAMPNTANENPAVNAANDSSGDLYAGVD